MKRSGFFNALIVDDEVSGRDQVAYHVKRHSDCHLIATVGSVDEALKLTGTVLPDLIFLDIDLPKKNGFELVNNLQYQDKKTAIVFVTAYDQYAVQAIRSSAFDYLLKPIDPQQFDAMLDRFRERQKEDPDKVDLPALLYHLKKPEKLRFNQKGRILFIDPNEIVCCRANGNYTEIILDQATSETVSNHLKEIGALLDGDFQRLGRSLIINKTLLSGIDKNKKLLEFEKEHQTIAIPVSARLINKI